MQRVHSGTPSSGSSAPGTPTPRELAAARPLGGPRSERAPRPFYVVAFAMASWYACSLITLFLNKSLLTTMKVPVHYLGMGQMCTTCFLGAVKVYGPRVLKKGGSGPKREDGRSNASSAFYRNLALVGLMRGATVVLGLVSLKHVAASFTEAIKSSAPVFTVVFAWIILKVRTR